MDRTISVIVITYNNENFIEKCLNSVFSQTLHADEVILVDSNSVDNSLQKAMQFKNIFKNLRLCKTVNTGPGNARNLGIKLSQSEYICFIDGDDHLHPDYLKDLFTPLINSIYDLSYCDIFINKAGILSIENHNPKATFLFKNASSCNKMFKKSLFTKNSIWFPEYIWYEDLATIPQILLSTKYSVYVPKALYYYFMNSNSITKTFSRKASDMLIVFDILSKNNLNPKITNFIYVYHGLIGTTYRMIKSKQFSSTEIITTFNDIKKLVTCNVFSREITVNLSFTYLCFLFSFSTIPKTTMKILNLFSNASY
ncbi:MAG: glycosyltransferase family A protein [Anaerorhabdus sp.]